jgi:hypothetical protein
MTDASKTESPQGGLEAISGRMQSLRGEMSKRYAGEPESKKPARRRPMPPDLNARKKSGAVPEDKDSPLKSRSIKTSKLSLADKLEAYGNDLQVGLGRIVALHHRSSTLHQIR